MTKPTEPELGTHRDHPLIHEHHLSVSRTARYHTLGEFSEALEQVWFVCHGYGQLAAYFIRHFETLNDGRRLIVAPEGLSRFYLDASFTDRMGASWMTREDRLAEINDYVQYLDLLYGQLFEQIERSAVRVCVLGFSQGVATVCRWLAQGSARAERAVLWAGMPPTDLDTTSIQRVFQRTPLELVYGTRDEYATPERVAEGEARLRAMSIPYRLRTFDGGHQLDSVVLSQVAETL